MLQFNRDIAMGFEGDTADKIAHCLRRHKRKRCPLLDPLSGPLQVFSVRSLWKE